MASFHSMPVYFIDSYALRMYSSRPNISPGVAAAEILLFGSGSVLHGSAEFFPDGTPLPAPVINPPPNGPVSLTFNLSQLPEVLQMLREERPLYVFEFGIGNAGLGSGSEPTGEEEGPAG
jgi:hypothetical protein